MKLHKEGRLIIPVTLILVSALNGLLFLFSEALIQEDFCIIATPEKLAPWVILMAVDEGFDNLHC